MTKIAKTRIGTSPALDICQGFALFPTIGTIRAGRTFSAPPGKHIINSGRKTILLWQFAATVDYRIMAGICGPAYAVIMDVAGEVTDDTATLNVELDEAAAGVFAGLTVFFPYHFQVRSGSVHWTWKKGFYTTWKTSWDKRDEKGFKIDVLKELIKFIQKKLKENKKEGDNKIEQQNIGMKGKSQEKKKAEGKPDEKEEDEIEQDKDVEVSSFAIYSQVKSQFAKLGELRPEPLFQLPIDIVPYIEPLAAVDAGLKALWGGLQLGPRLDFIVPVHVKPSGIAINDTALDPPQVKSGKITATGAKAVGTGPESLRLELTHKTEFKFGIALFTSISACKLFSLNESTPRLVLNELLGVKVQTRGYCNYLTSKVGDQEASNSVGSCDPDRVTVVFEP